MQSGIPTLGVGRVEPGGLRAMGLGCRPEVPDARLAGAGDEGIPFEFVERPVTDMGAGGVANVAGLEE